VTLDAALAATATLVAAAFAASTLERWLVRRRPHELAWTIALGMFALASAALWLAEAKGWSSATFRTFYLFGAILDVPWLALGTIYLLTGRAGRATVADGIRWGLVIFSGFAAGVMVTAPLRATVPSGELPEGRELFEPLPRILAAVGSGVAAMVVIGGALWSAWRLWRHDPSERSGAAEVSPRRLALGNVVIALGTLVLSASGTLAGRLGKDTAFALSLVAGVSVLFCGFLIATPPRPDRMRAFTAPRPAPAAATPLRASPLR
jgi:hypothetical protein